MPAQTKPGLRDVIAGQTSICWLDEENQNFYYRGYSIQDLAEHSTFEEVAYLMIYGRLPNQRELATFQKDLMDYQWPRQIADKEVFSLSIWFHRAHPMHLLAAMTQTDGIYDSLPESNSLVAQLEIAKRLIARLTTFCGYLGRDFLTTPLFSANSGRLARDFLRTVRKAEPDELEVRALDLAAILYAEHEFNASTFAVRLAASAHTDLYSAIVGAIGVLKGDRHGGANENAMKKMLEIGEPEKAKKFLDKFFETPGARLPGFGHAVYTRSDPRVAILKPWVKKLSETKGDTRWYEIALAMEEYIAKRAAEKGGRGVPANADLWTAPLYYLLGIPIELYTPIFAASRIAGWCAHYIEVRHQNKEPILRPRAEYVGPMQRYTPINQRE